MTPNRALGVMRAKKNASPWGISRGHRIKPGGDRHPCGVLFPLHGRLATGVRTVRTYRLSYSMQYFCYFASQL